MLSKCLYVLPLLTLAYGQPGGEDKAKKDLEFMQGSWVMQALEINGKEVPPQQLQDTTLTVKGDEYRTKVKDKSIFGFRLKLDPTQDPKAVDMILSRPGD